MAAVLEGIKVIDLSQVAVVPMCARFLADFGADVIHVEHAQRGDFFRYYQAGIGQGTAGPPSNINYVWENYNRNKRSMSLDLAQEDGQKIMYRLVEEADVLLTNMRLFERGKFGVDYDTLHSLNPRLVYGSLTGYGKKGPDRNVPAYDATAYLARSGVAHMLSPRSGVPSGWAQAFGDHTAALCMTSGIMLALFARERTGVGQEVDISLMHTGIYQIGFEISGSLVTGLDYDAWRLSSREEAPNPLVMVYRAKDDSLLYLVIVQPDRYWSRFCQAIEREDLEHDPRFESFEARAENRVELMHILDEVFASKTRDEWKARLEEIPHSFFQNLLEAINDPQSRLNDFFIAYDHPTYGRIEGVANPIKLSESPSSLRMPAPEFGQHTEEILLEYGYTWEDIARFKQEGIIA